MRAQEKVGAFIQQHGWRAKPEWRLLDLCTELGEIAKELVMQTTYGTQPLSSTHRATNLELELGDAYFSLLELANTLGVDLEIALDEALEKYERRTKSE
jgi:NTP pyrophosphatase (non-canonical NTP hydrolase)